MSGTNGGSRDPERSLPSHLMTDQPPPPIDAPPPPTNEAPLPPPPPATPAKPPSKARTYLIFGVIAVLLGVGAYMISQNQAADELAVGQCFDEPSSDVDITTVVKHACTEAHDAEVFHVAKYTDGDAYPISLSVDRFVNDTCVPAFEAYVGEPYETATEYSLGYFYPDRDAWQGGKRTFTCYVTREDDTKLTQSVKASAT